MKMIKLTSLFLALPMLALISACGGSSSADIPCQLASRLADGTLSEPEDVELSGTKEVTPTETTDYIIRCTVPQDFESADPEGFASISDPGNFFASTLVPVDASAPVTLTWNFLPANADGTQDEVVDSLKTFTLSAPDGISSVEAAGAAETTDAESDAAASTETAPAEDFKTIEQVVTVYVNAQGSSSAEDCRGGFSCSIARAASGETPEPRWAKFIEDLPGFEAFAVSSFTIKITEAQITDSDYGLLLCKDEAYTDCLPVLILEKAASPASYSFNLESATLENFGYMALRSGAIVSSIKGIELTVQASYQGKAFETTFNLLHLTWPKEQDVTLMITKNMEARFGVSTRPYSVTQ